MTFTPDEVVSLFSYIKKNSSTADEVVTVAGIPLQGLTVVEKRRERRGNGRRIMARYWLYEIRRAAYGPRKNLLKKLPKTIAPGSAWAVRFSMSRSSYSTEEERKLLARVLGEADLESNYVYGVPFVYQYVSGNVETFKLDGTLLRMFASEWEA